jgi:hypothetical protein
MAVVAAEEEAVEYMDILVCGNGVGCLPLIVPFPISGSMALQQLKQCLQQLCISGEIGYKKQRWWL